MNQQELERRFFQLYCKADYQARRKIDRDLHKILAKQKGESLRQGAFFKAVKDRNTTAVENILKDENHINVNIQDELGNTALIYAILSGQKQIVKVLLENEADPFIKNKKGKNSLDAAKLLKDRNEMIDVISQYSQ